MRVTEEPQREAFDRADGRADQAGQDNGALDDALSALDQALDGLKAVQSEDPGKLPKGIKDVAVYGTQVSRSLRHLCGVVPGRSFNEGWNVDVAELGRSALAAYFKEFEKTVPPPVPMVGSMDFAVDEPTFQDLERLMEQGLGGRQLSRPGWAVRRRLTAHSRFTSWDVGATDLP